MGVVVLKKEEEEARATARAHARATHATRATTHATHARALAARRQLNGCAGGSIYVYVGRRTIAFLEKMLCVFIAWENAI